MNHSLKGLLILSACLATSVYAQDNRYTLPELGSSTDDYGLLDTNASMSHAEYRQATNHNRNALGDYAMRTVQTRLTQIGVADSVAGITGTTAQLALGHASVNLNASKTFYLEVDDAIQQDRAMSVRWKLSW